jgi:hypothetical protein
MSLAKFVAAVLRDTSMDDLLADNAMLQAKIFMLEEKNIMLESKIRRFRELLPTVDFRWVQPDRLNEDEVIVVHSESLNLLEEHQDNDQFTKVFGGAYGPPAWKFDDVYDSNVQFGTLFSTEGDLRTGFLSVVRLHGDRIVSRFTLEYLSWPDEIKIEGYIENELSISQYKRVTELSDSAFEARYGPMTPEQRVFDKDEPIEIDPMFLLEVMGTPVYVCVNNITCPWMFIMEMCHLY